MSKIVNITLEEAVTFSKALTMTYPKMTEIGTHPITGIKQYERVWEPVDLTGYSFKGAIRKGLDKDSELVGEFDVTMLAATKGQFMFSMGAQATQELGQEVNWNTNYGAYSERVGLVGYYDIIATAPGGNITRIMQGQCYLSRSANRL